MHLSFAALALVPSICTIAAVALTTTPVASIASADTRSQRFPDQSLTLIPGPVHENSTTVPQSSSIKTPSAQPNTTLITPQSPIPFRVPHTQTTLLFHSFGAKIPTRYILQCLSLSLNLILEKIMAGEGKSAIENGVFTHTHLLLNGDSVTITVADFREVGRGMSYDVLRDTLSGIGDFMTEPGRGRTTLSYEIDVDERGYVGTGHVDYHVATRDGLRIS